MSRTMPLEFNREKMLEQLDSATQPWDMVIIGGGATGVGVALDAASRGYRPVLVEQVDFAKGTSSRSTKLVHGGVRYLAQGNISLVREALKERGILLGNAPHLVHDLPFVVPSYSWWERPYYAIGLKTYDLLSGKYSFGKSRILSRKKAVELIPNVEAANLRGGILYHDGQFDDTRLALNIAQTAVEHGAVMVNYMHCDSLIKNGERVEGIHATDLESGKSFEIRAKIVINATGPFTDSIRKMENPDAKPMISASQGIHIVLDRSFLQGDTAIMVPKTEDGRVLFAIPWHDCVVVGTTDTPIPAPVLEPKPLEEEIHFVMKHAALYMARDPKPEDVLSVYVGIRPLVSNPDAGSTAALSRDHSLTHSNGNMVTICGGKWTTYRKMAQDTVTFAAKHADLPEKPCRTENLPIHGAKSSGNGSVPHSLSWYGSDAEQIQQLARQEPELAAPLHAERDVSAAQVAWAARHEMARTVEDVLSRRTRMLLLGARHSAEAAPEVARILACELGRDEQWQQEQVEQYTTLASQYIMPGQ